MSGTWCSIRCRWWKRYECAWPGWNLVPPWDQDRASKPEGGWSRPTAAQDLVERAAEFVDKCFCTVSDPVWMVLQGHHVSLNTVQMVGGEVLTIQFNELQQVFNERHTQVLPKQF